MTTDSTGGYQPPVSERPLDSVSGSEISAPPTEFADAGSTTSKTDTAKDQAAQMGQTAKEKGSEVAGTAADQAKNVAGEAKTQARNLLDETQSQVREQAGTQKERATTGLRSLGDGLRSMAEGKPISEQSGMASDLARQASEKVHGVASWLESHEPAELLDELRNLARRKPGSFLLGAAATGALAGRLTRGGIDAKRSESDSGSEFSSSGGQFASSGVAPVGAGTVPVGTETAWVDPVTATPQGDVVAEETVVVEPDPYSADPYRSSVGGGQL
jgi:hypothetical protein